MGSGAATGARTLGTGVRRQPAPPSHEHQEITMRYRNATQTPMITLGRELDRFMDETFGRLSQAAVIPTTWTPAMDVSEDEQGLVVELEIPGMRAEEVEVTTEQGMLLIRGEKQVARQRQGVRPIITERTRGRFARSLQLPQGVDESKVEAEFAEGVLRIRVPRAALPQARRVEVRRVEADAASSGAATTEEVATPDAQNN